MLSGQELKFLLQYDPGSPMLSLYLQMDPAERERADLVVRSLTRDLPKESQDDERAVENYLAHEYDGSGRSVAIFSCRAQNFLRAYPFPLPLRSRARWTAKPYVKPLADLLDSYGDYGVALVDKQGVRLFHFHLGELAESEESQGEAVHRVKVGIATSQHGTRAGPALGGHEEQTLENKNLQRSADAAGRFFAASGVRRVMIAGTGETIAKFRAALPKQWQSLIAGTFPADHGAGCNELLDAAMRVAAEAESRREAAMVQRAITAAAKGQGGAIGLEDTLLALHDGRIHTLLLAEGYRANGFQCKGCGFLTDTAHEACPFCHNSFSPIEDAVEKAVEEVMRGSGEVEVVRENPALDQAGKIAAILRY